MSLAVKVDIKPKNFKGIAKKRQEEIKAGITKALYKTAEQGLGIIQDRTAAGVDINGQRFKPYSEKYAFFRAKNGRTPVNVDLNFTGQMMGNMSVKANSKRAVIYFLRASEAKKAVHNNKARPFFGFNRLEEKQLAKTFERFLP
jgi:hypothetical protein